jgi:4'-phosphopantetheinyl transferase EntD
LIRHKDRYTLKKRRKEFVSGRICARSALETFSVFNQPITMREDRSPVWPEGFVGSISHSNDLCAAVVTQQDQFQSVGLDIEVVNDFNSNYCRHICTENELLRMTSLSEIDKQRDTALIFSAKESFYKCQYQITKAWLDFHDVEILIDNENKEFSVEFRDKIINSIISSTMFKGKYVFSQEYILTGITTRNCDL